MAYAISLLLNADLAEAVSERWRQLADAGLSRSMLELGYVPHVTLAVFDRLDAEVAAEALDEVLFRHSQIDITLAEIATFGPGSGVCYVTIAPSPELFRLHEAVLDAAGEICRPYYQVGRWTPHCTLATGLADVDLGRAHELLQRGWPLTGTFEAADLVEFAPIVGIKRWALAA